MHVFYLHGFGSSPQSSKARFFADRLSEHGLTLHCPDLNEPDFSTLTTTRMIEQVDAAIAALDPGPVVLIGSSLGAFVAWHTAARQISTPAHATHPIERLVLLAPALDFGTARLAGFGDEELRQWRETGWREFMHYGYGETRRVHYALYDDAQSHDSAGADVALPALVFQGSRDTLVDPAVVRAFVAARPSTSLLELDDDHQLSASLDTLWQRTAEFIGIGRF